MPTFPRNDVKKLPVKGGRGRNDVMVAFFVSLSVFGGAISALFRGGAAVMRLRS